MTTGTRDARCRLGWLLGLALLVSCASPTGPTSRIRENEAHRQRFHALVGGDYDYRFQHLCFCAPGVTEPVRIQVRGFAVASVTRESDGQPVEADLLGLFPSVDGLFDEIRDALEADAEIVEVDYDASFEYPRDILIDISTAIADEERRYTASDLQPVG